MSIINEALKKAVREKQSVQAPGSRENIKRKLDLEFHPKKRSAGWGPVLAVLIGLLIAGPIVAPMFAAPFRAQDPAQALQNAGPSAKKAQFGMEESALFKGFAAPALKPQFNLSGIVFSPKEAYCILNDKVLKVGESVDGATLTKITPKGIWLEYNGEKIEILATD